MVAGLAAAAGEEDAHAPMQQRGAPSRLGRWGVPSVRLVTFNIHHGVGDDGRHDLARIAAVLADADPDVVCLQEVDRHFGPAARTSTRPSCWPARWTGAGVGLGDREAAPRRPARVRYGNALLTRLPVADDAAVRLPGSGEPRAALRADLVTGDGALRVVATHLSSDSARSRAAQAQALVDLLPPPGRPAVVVGDLNCGPARRSWCRCAPGWPTPGPGRGRGPTRAAAGSCGAASRASPTRPVVPGSGSTRSGSPPRSGPRRGGARRLDLLRPPPAAGRPRAVRRCGSPSPEVRRWPGWS